MWPFKHKSIQVQETQTVLGPFRKLGRSIYWEGHKQLGLREIRIRLEDMDGQPDPRCLKYIVENWENINVLEQISRAQVTYVTEKHKLSGVGTPVKGEVCLEFDFDTEAWGETVFVDFERNIIVAWCVAD